MLEKYLERLLLLRRDELQGHQIRRRFRPARRELFGPLPLNGLRGLDVGDKLT